FRDFQIQFPARHRAQWRATSQAAMQHDLIEAGAAASPASLSKLAASTDAIAGAKNRPHVPSRRPDAAALLRRIPSVNERPSRDPLEWCELLARPHQYRKSDRVVLTFLAIFQNR